MKHQPVAAFYPCLIRRLAAVGLLGLLPLSWTPQAGAAERMEAQPKELDDVGIDEKLGSQVPLDLAFVGSDGKALKLSEAIDGRRPLILSLNYADCPMLCSLQLDGLVAGLKNLEWTAGNKFQVLTVSIDPNESVERSKLFKDKYMAQYQRPEASAGWHFATGREVDIKALAAAVGFKYTYLATRKEYAHTAALIVLSPTGTVSRYLYGVQYDARDIRLALTEASQGKVGSTVDKILLYCFHYDATERRYTATAQNIMRLAGAVTVLILGSFLGVYWLRDVKKQRLPLG